jgi:transposase
LFRVREKIYPRQEYVDDCEKREVAVQMMLESAKGRNEIQVTERESQEAINDCGTVGR